MAGKQKNPQLRARLVLIGIFALFFIPVIAAVTVAVKAPHWMPFGQINHGELVQPPVANVLRDLSPLDAGPGIKHGASEPWVIAHVGRSSCDTKCEYALTQMRQARLALGKDASRVQRWWLVTDRPQPSTVTAMLQAYPGLRIGLLDAHSPLAELALSAISVQMIDPAGFLILRYPSTGRSLGRSTGPSTGRDEKKPTGLASALLKDFKRLLRISKQG